MHYDDTCPHHYFLRTQCSCLSDESNQGSVLSHKKGSDGFGKPGGLSDLPPTPVHSEGQLPGGWANTDTKFAGELMGSGYQLTCSIIVRSCHTAPRHPQTMEIQDRSINPLHRKQEKDTESGVKTGTDLKYPSSPSEKYRAILCHLPFCLCLFSHGETCLVKYLFPEMR